jgi:hypothetical protein
VNEHLVREEDRKHSLEIQIAVLAAQVEVTASGSMNIFGVFNAIGATGFPTQLPDLVVLVRVHYGLSSASATPKQTIFRFVDEDGVLHEFRLDAWFPPPPVGVWAVSDNMVTLKNFPIPASGEYCFEFWVDGHRLCALPLLARLVTPDQITPGGTPPPLAP